MSESEKPKPKVEEDPVLVENKALRAEVARLRTIADEHRRVSLVAMTSEARAIRERDAAQARLPINRIRRLLAALAGRSTTRVMA